MLIENYESAVLISGGTSGLGFQSAKYFVNRGHSVVICGRNQDSVATATKALTAFATNTQRILGATCDVSVEDSVVELSKTISKSNLKIEVLLCNAGVIGPIDSFLESDFLDWRNAFTVNLYGTVNLVREFLPSMLKRNSGRVIHISGGGATSPLFGMSGYAASKAAAVRFIETLALENKETAVTFNSVAPGMLKTKLLDLMLDAGPHRIGKELYAKSVLKADAPSDSTSLALELIYFLASKKSEGISGKLISAEWDNWKEWPAHLKDLSSSDLYTLRRITGRDRGFTWGEL